MTYPSDFVRRKFILLIFCSNINDLWEKKKETLADHAD